MAEEPAAPAAAPEAPAAPAAPAPAAPEAPQTVPYERFREVNEQTKTLKQQLDEVQTKLREREEADLSASEREKLARERAEQRAAELEGKVTKLERGSLVTAAAREAGFTDPEDALGFIDPTTIESAAQARRAVKDLAEKKTHLVGPRRDEPELGQVLRNGELVDPSKLDPDIRNAAARRQLNEDMRTAVGIRPQ